MNYLIAWGVSGFGAIVVIALGVYPFRHLHTLRWLVVALGAFWLLIPWHFKDGYFAPFYIVFLFQVFFEPDTDSSAVTMFAVLGNSGLVTTWIALLSVKRFLDRKSRYKNTNV